MGTVTATLHVLGQAVTASASYNVTAPNTLRIGWSCPLSSLAARLAQFPAAKYIRIFRTVGQGLPTWSSLEAIPGDVVVHLSVKDRGLPVGSWWSTRPPRWTAPLLFTVDHEPEQQDSGDPMPAEYWDEWNELAVGLSAHPKRGQLILTPTFTRYAAEVGSSKESWYADFGRIVEILGVDAVAFDVYNPGSAYQTSAQMFGWCVQFARTCNLPLWIAEWGRERMAGDDGTACAQRMRDDVTYLRRNGVRGAAWYYRGGDNLDTGDGGKPRLPERDALAELIREDLT